MNAGASINSKAPCHLYSSRLAGGGKICRSLPGRASLYIMPEIQAGIHVFTEGGGGKYIEGFSFPVIPEIFNRESRGF